MSRRPSFALGLLALLSSMAPCAAAAGRPPRARPASRPAPAVLHACGVAAGAESIARCRSQIVAGEVGRVARFASPKGYGPDDLRDAYAITGSGHAATTIAVVVAYHDASALDDLATDRSTFGLPSCTQADGCFAQVDQRGGHHFPPPDLGWSCREQSLDLDMASAMCPRCRLLVVEAEQLVVREPGRGRRRGGGPGRACDRQRLRRGRHGPVPQRGRAHWNHPGVAIAASSDGGAGPEFPASSEYVTADGATTLARADKPRGWREIAVGSGACSRFPKPAWQADALCAGRTLNDVAAVGDPATGVAVYGPDGSGASSWMVFGGSSVSAAIIAGVYGVNGRPATYGSDPYAHPAALHDIRRGGDCGPPGPVPGGPGLRDGPSGNGIAQGRAGVRGAALRLARVRPAIDACGAPFEGQPGLRRGLQSLQQRRRRKAVGGLAHAALALAQGRARRGPDEAVGRPAVEAARVERRLQRRAAPGCA